MHTKRALERNTSGSFLVYRKKEGGTLAFCDAAGTQQQGLEPGAKRSRLHSQSSSDEGGKYADQAPQHKRRAASPSSAHSNPSKEQQDELIAQLLQQSPALTASGASQQQQQQQQQNMPMWRQLLIAALLQKAGLPVLDEAAAAALPVPEPVLQQKAAAAAAARQASSAWQESADACKSSWAQGEHLTAESTEQAPCVPQAAVPTPGAGGFSAACSAPAFSSQPDVQPLTQQPEPANQHSQQQTQQQQQAQTQQQAPVLHALQHLVGLSDIVHAALGMPGVLEAAPLPAWARPARAALPAAEFADLQMSLPAGADLVAVITDILTAHHQVQAALAEAKQVGLLDTPAAAADGAAAAAATGPVAADAACTDACAPAAAGAYSFCDSDTSVGTAFGGSFSNMQPHSSCARVHAHSGFTNAPACSAQAVANALVVKPEAAAAPATPPAHPAAAGLLEPAAASAAGGVVQQLGAAYSKLSACSHGLTCLLLLEAAQHKQQQQAAAKSATATAGTAAAAAPLHTVLGSTPAAFLPQGLERAATTQAEPTPAERIDTQQKQPTQAEPQLEQRQTDRLVGVAQKVLKVAEGAAGLCPEDKLQLLSAVAELLVVVQEAQTSTA